ncbi:hypothetical protein G9A89_009460 [Geosiphon pyriformis]|nr:hypothetical protein G9A89_009460 [Geosiphon pyriformis]
MDQLGHQVDYAANARIIIANKATKTSIGKINNFFFEVNGIIAPIKVLVIEATQYQVLNRQHTYVPATCGHFKTIHTLATLIKLKEKKEKPIWKVYQVLWTDNKHNKLLLILL